MTEESKKTIMKKLIEIMDESQINDDLTPSVTNKPSEQSSIQPSEDLLSDRKEHIQMVN